MLSRGNGGTALPLMGQEGLGAQTRKPIRSRRRFSARGYAPAAQCTFPDVHRDDKSLSASAVITPAAIA